MTSLIRSTQLCKRLDISKPTEWRWRRAGILPEPIKINGQNYYRPSVIDEVIERHCKKNDSAQSDKQDHLGSGGVDDDSI
jgi:predicted DNA-binding transcriptional regulator AlpA